MWKDGATYQTNRFRKTELKKCTYKKIRQQEEQCDRGPPYHTEKYAEIDHTLISQRAKNTITNIENDLKANLESDHIPNIITTTQKMKRISKDKKERKTWIAKTEEERAKFNTTLNNKLEQKEVSLEN